MQEIHSLGGDGNRRPRLHHHQHHQHHHQTLKCPRCDSLNTKFCYYNNYNLSQPRHFCKNCRRYWTKGGVLRNIPVGGGCRKSKRSNNNNDKSSSSAPATTPTPQQPPEYKSNSHSSSESSTVTVTAAKSNAAFNSKLLMEDRTKVVTNPVLELEQGSGVFNTSLITSTNEALVFGFGDNILDTTSFVYETTQGNDQVQLGTGGGGLQQQFTVPLEFSSLQNKTGNGGFGSLDWHADVDPGLFDLSNTVDQTYWTHNHWSDQDNPTLFHLP